MAANDKNALDGVEDKGDVDVTVSGEGDAVPTGKFVQYVGDATHRVISEDDWKTVEDVNKAETNTWSFANAYKIESSKFSKAQLKYLLVTDGRFKAVDK